MGYQGVFIVQATACGFIKDTYWLVWNFESDSTLADAIEENIGKFPECLFEIIISKNFKECYAAYIYIIVRIVMKQLFRGLSILHYMTIIHRDIKPDNLLLTVNSKILFIDFGATCDISTQINFSPESGMLDPRYSPPEELVMPNTVVKIVNPGVAAFLCPIVWQKYKPDLFDTYSVGLTFLQLTIPEVRFKFNHNKFREEL